MKKSIVKILVVILCSVCFVAYKFFNATNVEETSNKDIKQNNNMLSMMIETEAGSGKYEMTSTSSWPTEGYVFNSEISKCENGGTLSWNDENKQVVFNGNISDKCYIYFDIEILTLSEYVIKQYASIQGNNNIYHHDLNLTNGAVDNSYRYAGVSTDVKNYLCLGSDAETCPEDNLYRIIGVFDENNHGIKGQQLVKVIKNTSYGNMKWNVSNTNDWSTASLNRILNSTYISEMLSGIENKVLEVSWKVSGTEDPSITANDFYMIEVTNATKTYTGKIGLMYASDYGFATLPEYWTTKLLNYNSGAYQKDWLYLGASEWLLCPNNSGSLNTCFVTTGGIVVCGSVTNMYETRPVFYLSFDVTYASGTGTSTDPIRVK